MLRLSSIILFFVLAGIFLYTACIKPPSYSEVPSITFKSLSKTTVKEGDDSLKVVFTFTDGDGDLGPKNNSDSTLDVFLTDSRDDNPKRYQLPNISPEGNIKAISGDVTISIGPFACRANVTNDKLSYKIQIRDRAGHLSNVIQTTDINLICN